MKTPKTPSRPKSFAVADIRVRAIRGPHKDRADRWYWQALSYRDGKQIVEWSGWGTLAEAKAALAPILAGQRASDAPAPDDRVETVAALCETWLAAQEARPDLATRTRKINTLSVRHLTGKLGDVRLDRLGIGDLERYRDERLRRGAATRTVELDLEIMARAWIWGAARGLCGPDPLPKVRIKHKAAREGYTPTRDEVWRVLDQMSGWPRMLTLLLACTGARIGEVTDATWADVDFERREIRVCGKTGPRVVVMPDALVDALRAMVPEGATGRILPVTAATAHASLSQRYLPIACEAAGVPRFSPHALRRFVLGALYEAGADVGVVAAMLGQSPTIALKHYRRARPEDKRRAMALAGLGERPAAPAEVVDLDARRRAKT